MNEDIVRRLLEAGSNVDAVDDLGRTPLHIVTEALKSPEAAASQSHMNESVLLVCKIIKLLIDAGAGFSALGRKTRSRIISFAKETMDPRFVNCFKLE